MRKHQGLQVDQMDVECIIDDNESIWLSSVSKTVVMTPQEENSSDNKAQEVVINDENSPNYHHSTSLPVLTNTRPDSASSANGYTDHNPGLLFKEGTVFRCSSGPDDLPGLKAWTLTSMASGEEMKWSIDLAEVSCH